jgi:hypothetical protein
MRGRLVRGVAILLLLLTGADLALPDCCGEESESVGTEVSANHRADDAAVLDTASDDSNQNQPTSPTPCTDECFCCLRMLQGVSVAALSAPVSVSQAIATKSDHLPSPPPQSTYHPPRIA